MAQAPQPSASAAAVDPDPAASTAAAGSHHPPWYRRYTRWRQTSREEAVTAETKLLSLTGVKLEAADVPVGLRKDEFMNTVVAGPADGPALVMIPGYGAGLGFFFRNLGALADKFRVHAVDLLGTGMSGRPPFTARNRLDAEAFFLDSLAAWRDKMGIDKMVLVGHSMGGYLSARYALRHPEHVQHLVLVCPAGVTNLPNDWEPPARFKNRFSLAGAVFRTFNVAWELGITPGGVIRTMGPYGAGLIQRYVRNRFRDGMGLSDRETAAFEQYFYHITAARGSGEHALRHILGPFAWAREALEEDLKDIKVPVTFIYGSNDWMDPAGARRACEGMAQRRPPSGPRDQQVITINEAGHYAFLDQPQDFLSHMLQICQPYLRSKVPQVPDARPVSPVRFPEDARNLRHFAGDAAAAATNGVHKESPKAQNGAAPPRRSGSMSPRRAGSTAAETAEDEMAHRTEL